MFIISISLCLKERASSTNTGTDFEDFYFFILFIYYYYFFNLWGFEQFLLCSARSYYYFLNFFLVLDIEKN